MALFKSIMTRISNHMAMRDKNIVIARKNLERLLSQDSSILDKYGFIQGTDKASVTGGG